VLTDEAMFDITEFTGRCMDVSKHGSLVARLM